MSYTAEEVAWIIAHPEAVVAAGELELRDSTQLADLARLRALVDRTDEQNTGGSGGAGADGAPDEQRGGGTANAANPVNTASSTNSVNTANPANTANAAKSTNTANSANTANAANAASSTNTARARALAELTVARRAALRGAKIPTGPDGAVRSDWMVCAESAQQATPRPVAEVRLNHLAEMAAGRRIADVTCSVGTEVAYLAGSGVFDAVVGADLDPARLAMARHNLPGVPLVRADAVVPTLRCDVIVADPARRTARGRIRDPRDLIPPLPDLVDAWSSSGAEVAVKCAPGIDYSGWEGQVDIVGITGGGRGIHGMPGVKEACLYTPGLARHARRAVVVGPEWTAELTTDDPESEAVAPVGRYILDPDGAVVRAGLVRQYAAVLGWWRVDPHIAYLSGDRLDATFLPGQRVFEVLDTVPVKKLRGALVALGCGSVEVLLRGVDIDPDILRKKLRSGGALNGTEPLTVVVARVGRSPIAVVARAVNPG